MRRVHALALSLGLGGVAGAVLDPDLQAGAFDRGAEVAADVGRQRLERRDVEGVEAGRRGLPKLGQGGEEARQGLAAAGGGDEQGGGGGGAVQHGLLVGMERPALGREPVGEGGGKAGHGARVGGGGAASTGGGVRWVNALKLRENAGMRRVCTTYGLRMADVWQGLRRLWR